MLVLFDPFYSVHGYVTQSNISFESQWEKLKGKPINLKRMKSIKMEEGETESVEIKRVNYQTAIPFQFIWLSGYPRVSFCCCSVYKSSLSYKSTDLTSATKTNKTNKKSQTTKDLPNEKKILGSWRMLWSLSLSLSLSVLNIHFQQQSYIQKQTNKSFLLSAGSRDDDAINILARTEIGLDDRIQVSKVETQKWFFLVCVCVFHNLTGGRD